ncbi:hypothetical protein Bxe_B1662 [Paraburkholderia xenovorans LB400]|uniref:Uncharacterized protein n=1 Tax=Paraburkholderia xenovorans (strain LB400) TaxID=266265 RepID=Q13NN5_PARXL|nr:hypothetical protein Bxe_B1662 [Paraburkholderia xenovorans LB400]
MVLCLAPCSVPPRLKISAHCWLYRAGYRGAGHHNRKNGRSFPGCDQPATRCGYVILQPFAAFSAGQLSARPVMCIDRKGRRFSGWSRSRGNWPRSPLSFSGCVPHSGNGDLTICESV